MHVAPVEAMTEAQIEAGAKALYGATKESLCAAHDDQLWQRLGEPTKRLYRRKTLIVINAALKAA